MAVAVAVAVTTTTIGGGSSSCFLLEFSEMTVAALAACRKPITAAVAAITAAANGLI